MMTLWKDAAFRSPFYGAMFAILGFFVKEAYDGLTGGPKEADPEVRQHLDKMIGEYLSGGAETLTAWLLENADEITTEQEAASVVAHFETHYPRVVAKRRWILQLKEPTRLEA